VKRLILVHLLASLLLLTSCASSGKAGQSASSKQGGASQNNKLENTDPLYSITLMRQGSILMQQGQYSLALERFQQADRIAPGNATVHNMIGLCYLRSGQYDLALQSFNTALELVPGFTDARNNRGATYMAMGQYHMAEVDFIAVLGDSTYPHRKEVYFNLGMTYLQRGQMGAAEENLRKSIILPNPVFDGYLALAQLAERQGELDLARNLLEEARLEFPDRFQVSLELGKLLMLMGEEDEARPLLEDVIAADPASEAADTARTLLGVDK
jgi:Tfp pilus assembly protein PilF